MRVSAMTQSTRARFGRSELGRTDWHQRTKTSQSVAVQPRCSVGTLPQPIRRDNRFGLEIALFFGRQRGGYVSRRALRKRPATVS